MIGLFYFTGTNTGRALTYLKRKLLKQGNREDAKDVVLLITDGAATDRVAIPALNLRKTGAMVMISVARIKYHCKC